jgi:glycosyltransferase involved in cell wall biosynthesis
MQNEILLQIPDLHSRCKVIHNGVDYKQLSQLKSDSSTRTSNNTLQVMTVARLDKQKDLATCIRAFAHVKSDIHLSIIGDGPQRKLLTDLIKQLNLSDRITLLGWQSNIPSCLSRADIYVQSSVWEGFSIGVLEAMAMGLPMVVSNAGALVEAVNNAGLIFPVGDAELLAQHLDSLAQNPGLRTEMSQQSLSRVKQFSLDNMWQQYDNVYRDIIKPAMHRSASF